jgi:hypothetical protein
VHRRGASVTGQDHFIYLLVEMEGVVERQAGEWSPDFVLAASRRLEAVSRSLRARSSANQDN